MRLACCGRALRTSRGARPIQIQQVVHRTSEQEETKLRIKSQDTSLSIAVMPLETGTEANRGSRLPLETLEHVRAD